MKKITRFVVCPAKIHEMARWSDRCTHPDGKCPQDIPDMLLRQAENSLPSPRH